MDQYAKHKLKIKYIFRYMDDVVALAENKETAKEYLNKLQEYLRKELYLELNSKTQICKSKQGINFCGYHINEYRLKIRTRGKKALKRKIKKLKMQIKAGELTSKEAKKYLCGHFGYMKIANVYNLSKKYFANE